MKKMIFTTLVILLLIGSLTKAGIIQGTWDTWVPIDGESYAPDEFGPVTGNPRARFPVVGETAGQVPGIEILPEFQGRSGVMKVIWEEGFYLQFPNIVDSPETKVTVETTYFNKYYVQENEFVVWAETNGEKLQDFSGNTIEAQVTNREFDGAWETVTHEFTITPGADFEVLQWSFEYFPGNATGIEAPYIDKIMITSEAVPEPTTLSLLAIGGLALFKRKP